MLFKAKRRFPQQIFGVKGLLCGLTFACCSSLGISSAQAAQTITIRFGPYEQSIKIDDLEDFANTGKLPSSLEALSPVLPEGMQGFLQRRLEIDPRTADKFTSELQNTSFGRQFITSLKTALPGSSIESVQGAISLALRQVNGLSVVGFLQAYPQENVTIDATKAISVAVRFNPSRLQSKAFGSLLARELYVKNQIDNSQNFRRFNPANIGNLAVEKQTITLQDRKRNRTIPVDIYSSRVEQSQQPLVVISHGFGASRENLGYLARHLASYGVSVAAIEHPGSNLSAINQATNAADLKKLINTLQEIKIQDVMKFNEADEILAALEQTKNLNRNVYKNQEKDVQKLQLRQERLVDEIMNQKLLLDIACTIGLRLIALNQVGILAKVMHEIADQGFFVSSAKLDFDFEGKDIIELLITLHPTSPSQMPQEIEKVNTIVKILKQIPAIKDVQNLGIDYL